MFKSDFPTRFFVRHRGFIHRWEKFFLRRRISIDFKFVLNVSNVRSSFECIGIVFYFSPAVIFDGVKFLYFNFGREKFGTHWVRVREFNILDGHAISLRIYFNSYRDSATYKGVKNDERISDNDI